MVREAGVPLNSKGVYHMRVLSSDFPEWISVLTLANFQGIVMPRICGPHWVSQSRVINVRDGSAGPSRPETSSVAEEPACLLNLT